MQGLCAVTVGGDLAAHLGSKICGLGFATVPAERDGESEGEVR